MGISCLDYNDKMHELAITEEILHKAEEIANQENALKVNHIYLQIGKLSGIMNESVQFYWNSLCKNTICAEAMLHFEILPALMHCENCGNEYELANDLIPCPTCGSLNLRIAGGEDFILKSIEIEK